VNNAPRHGSHNCAWFCVSPVTAALGNSSLQRVHDIALKTDAELGTRSSPTSSAELTVLTTGTRPAAIIVDPAEGTSVVPGEQGRAPLHGTGTPLTRVRDIAVGR
jgi:hypothetical protein